MQFITAVCIMLFLALPVEAASRSVTFYLDGALFEQEITVTKGSTDVYLPAAMNAGSLRIKPLDGSSIAQVDIFPVKPDQKHTREVTQLTKRRDALMDRLQALDAREAVFKAAAKSQSGKSPRKTKTNPDPMAIVRQGTEFAIAQLESVYRARRVTEGDLKSIEERLAAMNKEGTGRVARVRMSGKGGRMAVSYLRSDLKWIPAYDFRLNKPGEADVVMRALLPKIEKGAVTKVVPAILAEAADEAALPVPPDIFPQIAAFNFSVDQEKSSSTPVSSISFSFRNSSARRLPAGEVSCYRRGEFLGKTIFGGSLPGDASTLAFGR
jgi:hypothetical protein